MKTFLTKYSIINNDTGTTTNVQVWDAMWRKGWKGIEMTRAMW